ncbi:MAG: putative membrane protein [Candidatus Azotimanducaceae bacterium]|jgi:putative membrane protein
MKAERNLTDYFWIGLKGFAMGAANVIPGVSGGTIALITGIYEEFLMTLKSINLKAFKLFFTFQWTALAAHINIKFLASILIGTTVSLFTIAKLFKYLFASHPIQIWAFFFGLILASVYFIGKTVSKWNVASFAFLLLGATIAIGISFLEPASENTHWLYILICGVVGISGMMLPGLSGSFILILMGNYELLMVKAIANLNLWHIVLFGAGSIAGLMVFSHILTWILHRYKDITIALLTGFVFGSLNIIWPWKEIAAYQTKANGDIVPIKYDKFFPTEFDSYTLLAFGIMISGIVSIWMIEYLANRNKKI